MLVKKKPGAVKRCARGAKRCARSAKPYNNRMFLAVLVVDGLVAAWASLDGAGLINPAIYGAISILLKTANVAIHFTSKAQGSADDGDQTDNG